jgi:hypothetical protein
MNTPEHSLERECRVFTEYLLGCAPHPYVERKYADAHRIAPAFSTGSRFDFFLIRAARSHRGITKLADAYARLFVPASLLRKKLVLLLAILETCSPSCHLIDSAESGGKRMLLVRLCRKGCGAFASAIIGVVLFFPVQIVFAAIQRFTGGVEQTSQGVLNSRANTSV